MECVNNRRVIFGTDVHKQIPDILKKQGSRKAFLVVFKNDDECVRTIRELLSANGIEQVVFDKVHQEPNLTLVDEAAEMCRSSGCDSVIAIGGGSIIDTSKLIAMLATNEGDCEDYQLNRRTVKNDPLFYIAMPTTCGTGAEATKVAVVFNEKEGWKKAVYDTSMIADVAVLDPVAIAKLPTKIAVFTGMDAIVHAMESAVSNNSNSMTEMYSHAALKLLYNNICRIVDDPNDMEAKANMLTGSYLAGCALTAGAGLAHIVGQPLGALYHVPHGASCSIFLIPTLKLNKEYAKPKFLELAKTLDVSLENKEYDEVFDEMISKIETMMEHIDAPRHLYDYYPEDMDIEAALDNIQSCMAHIKSNPRPSERELWRECLAMAK